MLMHVIYLYTRNALSRCSWNCPALCKQCSSFKVPSLNIPTHFHSFTQTYFILLPLYYSLLDTPNLTITILSPSLSFASVLPFFFKAKCLVLSLPCLDQSAVVLYLLVVEHCITPLLVHFTLIRMKWLSLILYC